MKADIKDIGLPKGVQGVEKYTRLYERGDPDVRLPGHVAASIHWNQLLDQHKDKDSMKIISGLKIKVYYLKQKYGKFKSVAIPTDIEVIPSWFIENYPINREMQVERLVDKPLMPIMEAINRFVPTKQTEFENELFEY